MNCVDSQAFRDALNVAHETVVVRLAEGLKVSGVESKDIFLRAFQLRPDDMVTLVDRLFALNFISGDAFKLEVYDLVRAARAIVDSYVEVHYDLTDQVMDEQERIADEI